MTQQPKNSVNGQILSEAALEGNPRIKIRTGLFFSSTTNWGSIPSGTCSPFVHFIGSTLIFFFFFFFLNQKLPVSTMVGVRAYFSLAIGLIALNFGKC